MSEKNTAGLTPFHFDFRSGDLGHRLIAGQPSAGKSVLVAKIAARFASTSSDATKASPWIVLVQGIPGAGMTLAKPNAGDDAWK